MVKKLIVFIFAFLVLPSQAVSLHHISKWVSKTQPNLSTEEARLIVDTAFQNSTRFKVDPTLILALAATESRFQINAKSSYGAKGLMQVVPRFHQEKLNGRNPYGIETAIEVGTKVFSDCMRRSRYKTSSALRCYSGHSTTSGSRYQEKVLSYRNQLILYTRKS